MFPAVISNSTSLSEEASASVSSGNRVQDYGISNPIVPTISSQQPQKIKKKRNLPGNPDPDAEVIALSPSTLLTTNRFVCEICNKGFQRDQNLQLHRRGHNLPWKLKQRNSEENRKKVYVCPEPSCVHHHPSRALGDLTGIKKHFCRKHWEKKWKCEKCSKFYAVQSDWKAHTKTCGTREYKCDCGILFNRKDSFISHKSFCDALAQESARLSTNLASISPTNPTSQPFSLYTQPQNLPSYFIFSNQQQHHHHLKTLPDHFTPQNPNPISNQVDHIIKTEQPPLLQKKLITSVPYEDLHIVSSSQLSATALLQKAASVGAHSVGHVKSTLAQFDMGSTVGHVSSNGVPSNYLKFTWKKNDGLTRDFLGLTGEHCGTAGTSHGNGDANGFGSNRNVDDNRKNNMNVRNVLSFTGGLEFPTTTATYERNHAVLKYHQGFGFAEPVADASETWGNC